VVAVADEVHVADLERGDRGQRVAAAHHARDALPAPAHLRRGGAELAVEATALAVDGPDDRVERDRLQAEVALADAAELGHDLVEGQHDVDVAAGHPAQPAQRLGAARAQEVVLRVGTAEPRAAKAAGHGV
jgi:hypothetical protein